MGELFKIESYTCDSFSDAQHCEFHSTILKFVTATVSSGLPDLPPNLYWSYKGYVHIELRLYQKIIASQKHKYTSLDLSNMNESLQDARKQTETHFYFLCRWIELILQSNIPNEEHDRLATLVKKINQAIREH